MKTYYNQPLEAPEDSGSSDSARDVTPLDPALSGRLAQHSIHRDLEGRVADPLPAHALHDLGARWGEST